jgi:hypothetical protein
MIGEAILITIALAYSAAVAAIGRRLPRPASIAAYSTAVAILIGVPLLPDPVAQRVDHLVPVVGAGRLLVHLAFMTATCGLYLTIVLGSHRWAWPQHLAVGGTGGLTALFVVLWLVVHTLPRSELAVVFYGLRAGHPPLVLWMNVVMGAGIVYIGVWGFIEFHLFLRAARRPYERGMAWVALGLYVLQVVAGSLTIVEAVARRHNMDMTVVQQVKTPFTASMLGLTAAVLVGQTWLWPLWRERRQLLARYVAPELAHLRQDLLNLSAVEAQLHLDIHQEAYANRTIVEAVVARCRAAGIPPDRSAIARMATSLITFQRDNLLQDPTYGVGTSWAELMQDTAMELNKRMAATAWEQALREGYIAQHVYILMFLVLDDPAYREQLLIDVHPRTEAWHQQLADLIATVMHEHGHATPRYTTLAQRTQRLQRYVRWVSRWRQAVARPGLPAHDPARRRDNGTSTT